MPTIEARITGVQKDEGTGWYRIATDHDKVKRLDTKHEPKAREALALKKSGDPAVIEYTPNPRYDETTGRTYQNNYYERAVAQSSNGGGSDEIPVTPAVSRRTNPGDAWRISLAAGAKLAVATLPLLPADQRDLESQFRLAQWWGRKLFFTPQPENEGGFGNTASGISDFDGGEHDLDSYNYGDDDIPFGNP